MREKGLLVNAWSAQGIVSGTKTSTLRIMKPQPSPDTHRLLIHGGEYLEQVMTPKGKLVVGDVSRRHKSKYQVFDHLWLQEAWQTLRCLDVIRPSHIVDYAEIKYVADGGILLGWGKLRPSIYLPKRFARPDRWKVLDVQVRRPRELTEDEVIAEGISYPRFYDCTFAPEGWHKRAFEGLWDSIYGPGAYEKNPWCWYICFEKVK